MVIYSGRVKGGFCTLKKVKSCVIPTSIKWQGTGNGLHAFGKKTILPYSMRLVNRWNSVSTSDDAYDSEVILNASSEKARKSTIRKV